MNTYCAVLVNSAEEAMKAKHAAAVAEIEAMVAAYDHGVPAHLLRRDRGKLDGYASAIEHAAKMLSLTEARRYVIQYFQWNQQVQLASALEESVWVPRNFDQRVLYLERYFNFA